MVGDRKLTEVARVWVSRLSRFLPDFLKSSAAYGDSYGRVDVILHGSTARGISDELSDLDLSVLMAEEDLAKLEAVSRTRYIEFELDGKPGSLKAESAAGFSDRVDGCDMVLIAELRPAVVMIDGLGVAASLIARARKPMRDEVIRGFFFYHYFEMRSYHRNADNPMQRGDPVAVYVSTAMALAHALRASMMLDGEPYPYEKWLYDFAVRTPTGSRLRGSVEAILDHLGAGVLRLSGPERDNPLSLELRAIRTVLIEVARSKGIDEPWLSRWWEHINQARAATGGLVW